MSKPLDGTGQKRLHREWRRRTEGRLALLLDSVQTPFNVGAILRTAAAFRVEHLWLSGATESPAHPKTRKTALGTDRYLTWSEVESPAEAADEAREAGYTVVGIELATDARPLFEVDCTRPVCLALGHEERGLSAAALASCDAVAYIPMLGKVGSLNVAAAAAIACYEVRRQEWTAASAVPGDGDRDHVRD
jgi:tRNA (guanosine-2'-O-)-methyltransferase